MKTYVVINRHKIQANKKLPPDERQPPIRVTQGKHGKPEYFFEFDLPHDARIVYDPENPMPCGASLWIICDPYRGA